MPTNELQPIAVAAVPVPRSLRHTFPNRVGVPDVSPDVTVPPAFERVLSNWLDSGSLLVVSAPRGSGKSVSLAAWLRTRAERIFWMEGSDLHDQADALDAVLDGLYELDIITQNERMSYKRLWDATDAVSRESSPIIMVINDGHLVREITPLDEFSALAAHWPHVRWVYITDVIVPAELGLTPGITVVGAADLRDPLASLDSLAASDSRGRADRVRDWAAQHDPSGAMFHLMVRLSQYLSVRRISPEFDLVENADAVLAELFERRVINIVEGDDGVRISLVPEFREALSLDATSATPESVAFHRNAAIESAATGDDDATIFHLARSGQHVEALKVFGNIPILELSGRSRLEAIRSAAAAIDITAPAHSAQALATRLQIALVPPLESERVRDDIQEALQRAQSLPTYAPSPALEAMVWVTHAAALVARGRYQEARVHGRGLAESLLALPWLELGAFGIAPTLAWTGQAMAELLDARVDLASKFGRVAHESAGTASMTYSLYLATTILAAVEAQRGELVLSEAYLAEAQRVYRRWGWSRSVAQVAEFVARFLLARSALDVDAMADLRLDISVIPNLNATLTMLMKICECFVYLHSGHATQTRVSVRQLGNLMRDTSPGALLNSIGAEMTFEAMMRAGEPQQAFDYLDAGRKAEPDGECVIPLLAAALVALEEGERVLEMTDPCIRFGSHHSPAGHSLLLLVRAAAHELAGNQIDADDTFDEALLTQQASPMPYLFLLVPVELRIVLWGRVSEPRKREWIELRRFLATVPEAVAEPDDALPHERLTAREMEILRALAVGGTLNEIAASQFVSRNTVKTHVRVIYRKLHVNSRVEAAELMKRFGQQLLESTARI